MLMAFQGKAQQAKFGHINSQELLKAMPDLKVADSSLAKYKKELEDTYNMLIAEYQTQLDDYNKNAPTYNPSYKKLKEDGLTHLQDQIQQFQQTSQDSFEAKKQVLYSPILDKASEAVKAVAKDNGYAYVFDSSAAAILYTWPSDDLMPLVKTKLNIK